MNPFQFENLYHNVPVMVYNSSIALNINIHRYRRNDHNEEETELNALKRAHRNEYGNTDTAREERVMIQRCFLGKGSVEAYRRTLQYTWNYRPQASTNLQRYADDFLGLDYRGFVSNPISYPWMYWFGPIGQERS